MKKTLLFVSVLMLAVGQAFSQVWVYEPFDYSPTGASLLDGTRTNSVTGTTWNNYTGGSPNDMTVEVDPGWGADPDIASQAFELNPTGNAVYWQGGGEDGELDFPAVSGEGNVIYLSFLLDVVGWATTTSGHAPERYRHINLGINDNGNVGSGLHIGPTDTGGDMKFRLALGNSDQGGPNDIVWYPTEYTYTDLGTDTEATINQFFIVIKYVIGTGASDGTDPGVGYMWVNPSISSPEPAPDVTHFVANAARQRTSFQSVLLQASSNNRNPASYIDEIRVAGSWEEALGLPALSVSENELSNSVKLYPNPASDYLVVETDNIEVTGVELFNVVGSKVLSATSNRLDVSGLTRGIYFAKINADGASITKRIVLK